MPGTKRQIKAISASYHNKGKEIPVDVREEMKYYGKHPKKD